MVIKFGLIINSLKFDSLFEHFGFVRGHGTSDFIIAFAVDFTDLHGLEAKVFNFYLVLLVVHLNDVLERRCSFGTGVNVRCQNVQGVAEISPGELI